jgi:DNA-binding CsgD family transcriptional regulator/PAS domain-containing protein
MHRMRKFNIEPVLDQIYGSLVDRDWPAVLQTTADVVGGDGAVLHVNSRVPGSEGSFTASSGLDDSFDVNEYLTHWEPRSPLIARYRRLPEGLVGAPGPYGLSAAYRNTEFYQDWVRPQGYGDMLGSHLIRTPALSAWLNIRREHKRGLYSQHQVRIANEIGRHIARAIRLSHRIDIHADRATTLKATLDAVSFGLIISDEGGNIIEANRAADLTLSQGAGLRSRARRLVCENKRDDDVLRRALKSQGLLPADADLTVTRGPAAPPLFIHVVHLPAATHAYSGDRSSPVMAIFIVDPLATPISLDAFERAYEVSHAEGRLLQQLMATDNLSQAAQAAGVGLATAKTHLAHLFRKTGTNSQVQLIKLVMKTLLPLRQQ